MYMARQRRNSGGSVPHETCGCTSFPGGLKWRAPVCALTPPISCDLTAILPLSSLKQRRGASAPTLTSIILLLLDYPPAAANDFDAATFNLQGYSCGPARRRSAGRSAGVVDEQPSVGPLLEPWNAGS